MANSSEQGEKIMTNGNGNGNHKNELEEQENKKLKRFLQKAVKAETAPDSLREKISKMIREK